MSDIVSPLLSDPPAVPQPKDLRADEDYAASVAAGFVESLEAFGARITARQAAALDVMAIGIFATVALTGRRYLRRTR
ncbi:hypothetical protein [Streptomyces xanthophaeus]|uniref:hypothetical protein n=1 Tax=Streptomyces xanthophaeus TaxID=67385 RepID=UPI00371C5176